MTSKGAIFILKVFFAIFMMSLSFATLVSKIKDNNFWGITHSFANLIIWIMILVFTIVIEKGEYEE